MIRLIALGGLFGTAWACGMRAWMQQFAGPQSHFSWFTFTALIVPAALTGALFGLAEHRRRQGRPSRWFLLAVVPLVLGPLMMPNAIADLIHHGQGGDIGMVGFSLAGAYALAGSRRWLRIVLGIPAAGLAVLVLSGGWRPGMEITTPYGLWAAILLDSLYACFAVAATIPLLPAIATRPGRPRRSRRDAARLGSHDAGAARA
jgi:hypothetical protein